MQSNVISPKSGLAINETRRYSYLQLICCCKCLTSGQIKGTYKIEGQEIWKKFKESMTQRQDNDLVETQLIQEIS